MEIDRRETGGILLPQRKEQHLMEKTTMSVQELSAQMGISLPKAYELVKTPGFPTIRIGADEPTGIFIIQMELKQH